MREHRFPLPRRVRGDVVGKRRRLLVVTVVLAIVASGTVWWVAGRDTGSPDPAEAVTSGTEVPATPNTSLDPTDLGVLARAVAGSLGRPAAAPGPDSSVRLRQSFGPVFAAARSGGSWLGSAWATGSTTIDAVTAAVAAAAPGDGADGSHDVDTVELCLSHSYRAVELGGEGRRLLTNVHVGVLGVEIENAGRSGRYSPTLMLANNWDFQDVIARFGEANGLGWEDLAGAETVVRAFGCDQVLVTVADPPHAVRMDRGNRLVPVASVTPDAVELLVDLMGGWLTRQVDRHGRMTYAYWPSRHEESDANNMIRQWMATVALGRLARHRGNDQAIFDLGARNIRYNLEEFYEDENGLGLVVEPTDGDVKLGAVALAALAIVEHPRRREFAQQEAALRRTIDSLWREDGSFRTFYRPADRNDNQNFYPGEALLLWATLYRESNDPVLLERFMASFHYYRAWHLDEENRNPAFVPWHTQAYTAVWRETEDRRLRDFIFEINDWLLEMQQWETAPYPDLRGRFYDPDRPDFGPPHASSTGVYLEGLSDAYRIAEEVDDVERAGRYRLAIRRGLRSVMQLQFVDDVDLYYAHETGRVRGGIRTEVYDNVIRVDNVQHNLMAAISVLDSWPGRRDLR